MVIENKYENWKDIPWNKIRLEIYNLQYKIYCHAKKKSYWYAPTLFIQPINLISKLRLLLGMSRVSGDAHAWFLTRGVRLATVPRLEHQCILERKVVPRVYLFECDVFLSEFVKYLEDKNYSIGVIN